MVTVEKVDSEWTGGIFKLGEDGDEMDERVDWFWELRSMGW